MLAKRTAANFRPIADKYIYRAPNPWVLGRSDHYLVTEAQRGAILDILVPKTDTLEWRRSRRLGIGALALCALSLVVALLLLYGNRYPHAETVGLAAAAAQLLVLGWILFALHGLAMSQRQKLQPILASAPRSNERISNTDILWALKTTGDSKETRRAWMIGGVLSAVFSAAFAIYALITWQEPGGLFEKLQPCYFLLLAIGSAAQSATNFDRSRMIEIPMAARTTDRRFKVGLVVVTSGYLALAVVHAVLQLSGVIEPDYAAMRGRFERAAATGDAAAMNSLGWLYREGKGVEKNDAQAREWYERAAAAGNGSAMFWLGWLSHQGLGGPRDDVKAGEWFEAAAATGEGTAMSWNGALYQYGWGVPKDYVKAREWYEKSAAANNAEGMHNLGEIYRNGWGVTQEYPKALEWYQKAATAGYPASMNELGVMYINGWGVPRDPVQAREWYEKAAAAGNLDGMQHTAIFLDRGEGGPSDFARAAHLILQSAKLGDRWSQKVLAGPLIFLTPATRTEIKRELVEIAHYDGPIDDRWDDGARATVAAYLKVPG